MRPPTLRSVAALVLISFFMGIASAQTPAAVDEERRLLYVALTRAEEELWCSWFAREAGPGPAGTTSRAQLAPSPWLAPVEAAVARLEEEAAPTAAAALIVP